MYMIKKKKRTISQTQKKIKIKTSTSMVYGGAAHTCTHIGPQHKTFTWDGDAPLFWDTFSCFRKGLDHQQGKRDPHSPMRKQTRGRRMGLRLWKGKFCLKRNQWERMPKSFLMPITSGVRTSWRTFQWDLSNRSISPKKKLPLISHNIFFTRNDDTSTTYDLTNLWNC